MSSELLAGSREWLVTNGIGGYASGTVAGHLTRRYHGYLMAALDPPLGRTLLLAKLDETAGYDGLSYPLFTNRWAGEHVNPHGYRHVESFNLDGSIPVWRFNLNGARLKKRIWMAAGANTTYIYYSLVQADRPLALSIKAFANYRDYHGLTQGGEWQMNVEAVDHGLQVTAFPNAVPFYVLSDAAEATPSHAWHAGYDLALERYRGMEHHDDHLLVGTFRAMLDPGQSLTLVASTTEVPALDGRAALAERHRHERALLTKAKLPRTTTPEWIQRLVLAADQFVVDRSLPDRTSGKSMIAGYPWFGDWGRDTMISLPGLALVTGRPEVARTILRTYAQYVDGGMLPNRFPDSGREPEYNTVDATLWYFQAIDAYHQATHDDDLLAELFLVLVDIIAHHQQGTRYNISVDPADGLLYAGQPGVQLTWMDAKVDDWVVTPRIGKPVEVNALWYNALRAMVRFARLLGESHDLYEASAQQTRDGFGRFWNEAVGYCYDVLDGPEGHDPVLRPNQIFAVSLPDSPLSKEQQRAAVDVCGRHLLTSYGLRSLAPGDVEYQGHYGGDIRQRDGAYHQGTVWGWLLGPYCLAHYRVYRDEALVLSFLAPMASHLDEAGLGSLSEIFDGDDPFTPRGCFAQAWSVAETLRAWWEIAGGRR
ncbi:MAG: glycogen debranching enzyme family protein [Chloroflexota bacterium]|nr:MAG: glycogen debranching enzyme family protein [Chloroflexota bacterium]